MTIDPKSVLLGAAAALLGSALLGGDPLYIKGMGLEVQLNGARAVAVNLAQAVGGAPP